MTQFAKPTLDPVVDDGTTLSAKSNGAWNALYSNHAGAAAPPSPVEGQAWLDTSQITGSPRLVVAKNFQNGSWFTLGTLNLDTGIYSVSGGVSAGGGSVTGPIIFPSGSAAAPSITFTGDTDTGIFRLSADTIAISSGGLSVFEVGASIQTTRNMTISRDYPGLTLNRTTADEAGVFASRSGVLRWGMLLGDATPETGSNAGSDFYLIPYSDAGANLQWAMRVLRNTGDAAFKAHLSAGGQIWGQALRGGVGDAGVLKCYGTNNTLNFGWNGQDIFFRLDEAVQHNLATQTNARLLGYSGGSGGPTGVSLNGTDTGGQLFGIFVDAVSDERIKEDIEPTQHDALATILALPVRQFNIKADVAAWQKSVGLPVDQRTAAMAEAEPVHVRIGFVAQEMGQHIPEARNTHVGSQPPGCPIPDDVQTIVHQLVVPYLVRAVQQQQELITAMQARIAALEGASP